MIVVQDSNSVNFMKNDNLFLVVVEIVAMNRIVHFNSVVNIDIL